MIININGFFMAKVLGSPYSKFDFRVGDIYLKQKAKWLKDDSIDESRFFVNMHSLKTAKSLIFHTFGKYGGDMLGSHQNILFREQGTDKNFQLRLMIVAGKTNMIANCENCNFVQSTVIPTISGTFQSIEIKYEDISIWNN